MSDLQKLQPLRMSRKLDALESEAIAPASRVRTGIYRTLTGVTAILGGSGLVMYVALALGRVLLDLGHPVLLSLEIVIGVVATFATMFKTMDRYLAGTPKPVLSALLEPQAKTFTLDAWERRKKLVEDTRAYNHALWASQRALPAPGDDDIVESVTEHFAERRRSLEDAFDAYAAEFRAAAADDIRRVASLGPEAKRLRDPARARLKEYKTNLWRLKELEESLEGLRDPVGSGLTVDISPYVAAERLRSELEDEREALIALGKKPKRLPSRRITKPKLLTEAAG